MTATGAGPIDADTEPSDEALMVRYRGDDRRAFELLYARLAPRVHGFFRRSFGSAAVADDLLQQTFLKLHKARADFQADRSLRPWLFAIASRVRLDELRRRYRLAESFSEEDLDRADLGEAQTAESSHEALEKNVLARRVRRAVERLPETQRVVVHLHRFEGMTFPEIATVLAISEGAVKLRAFRAYEQLRQDLRGLLSVEDAA